MQNKGIYSYYAFGHNYCLIKNKGLAEYDKASAVNLLEEFFEYLSDLELQVTRVVATKLSRVLIDLKESDAEDVDKSFSTRILNEIGKIDPTLDAELLLKKAYVLTKKRYSIESLLSTPKDLLGEGVFDKLSVNAQKDFSLGCRQIALNQGTSAAFHLMRTLEDHVKGLYFSFKKTNRLDKPMWGPMIQQLRAKKAPKPSTKLLDHLDSIRVHFRNPTQHPDLFYTIDDAQDLLNQTITAINMICAELPKPKASKANALASLL